MATVEGAAISATVAAAVEGAAISATVVEGGTLITIINSSAAFVLSPAGLGIIAAGIVIGFLWWIKKKPPPDPIHYKRAPLPPPRHQRHQDPDIEMNLNITNQSNRFTVSSQSQ